MPIQITYKCIYIVEIIFETRCLKCRVLGLPNKLPLIGGDLHEPLYLHGFSDIICPRSRRFVLLACEYLVDESHSLALSKTTLRRLSPVWDLYIQFRPRELLPQPCILLDDIFLLAV